MPVTKTEVFITSDGGIFNREQDALSYEDALTTLKHKYDAFFEWMKRREPPVGMGYEYLDARAEDKIQGPGGIILYNKSYDIIEDATMAARQAKQMIAAKSVEPGKYDMVLEPSHLWLTIHESVGHPLELDRVLGYEANYAGTSFATLDKLQSKSFQYGNKVVTEGAGRRRKGGQAQNEEELE